MIKGRNILCFGSENWDYPGFQQCIMRNLSSYNRIIFVNPLGSRKVILHYSQINFYIHKIKRTFTKKFAPSANCIVCSPLIIPFLYSSLITRLNRILIKFQFSKLLREKNFEPYILWIGTPTAAILLDFFNPVLLVYHAVDRYSEFPFVDRNKILIYESIISKKADTILCTSDAIKNDLIKFNKSTYTVTHAVDFENFNSAIKKNYNPKDIRNIPKPIIGYFGGLSERVNFSLIIKIANNFPNANIVLIGKRLKDLSELYKYRNVHVLGYKPLDILPHYLKQFSICLIPYHINKLMKGVDPIKLREYLCLGKPVVSVNLPEVRKLSELVYIADDEKDFVSKVGEALRETQSPIREKRIQYAAQCDWSVKIEEISIIIENEIKKKDLTKNIFDSYRTNRFQIDMNNADKDQGNKFKNLQI